MSLRMATGARDRPRVAGARTTCRNWTDRLTPLPVDTAASFPTITCNMPSHGSSLAAIWLGMTSYFLRAPRRTAARKLKTSCAISRPEAQAPVLTFEDTMLTGLARDGGLYVPETIPQIDAHAIAAMAGQTYEEIAYTVMRPFVGRHVHGCRIQGLISIALMPVWPRRARAAGAIGTGAFPAGTVPRPDAGVQGFCHAVDRPDVSNRPWRAAANG